MPLPQTPEKKNVYPPWIVTFADMVTLLLTFFILLTSMATFDSVKYKEVADALEQAFGPGAGEKIKKIARNNGESAAQTPNENSDMAKRLKSALSDEIGQGLLEVEMRGKQTVVRFPEKIAFQSGSEQLNASFNALLDKVTGIIAKSEGNIVVVGHSDDVPISNERFRSNWDLSTARAVSVLHALKRRTDVDPRRLIAQGVADTQPLYPNDNPAHRAANRRVEVLIFESAGTPPYEPARR